jgi:hypothetical protein
MEKCSLRVNEKLIGGFFFLFFFVFGHCQTEPHAMKKRGGYAFQRDISSISEFKKRSYSSKLLLLLLFFGGRFSVMSGKAAGG